MKIVTQRPQISDLQKAYNHLHGSQLVPLNDLIRYVQWTRFDPRLLEVVAENIIKYYKAINPFEFNELVRKQSWPACAGVVLKHSEILSSDKALFSKWKSIALHQIKPALGEIYFFGLFDFQMNKIQKILTRPSKIFLQWGFLHDEICLNKAERIEKTVVHKAERMSFLKKFIQLNSPFQVEDYRRALNYQISTRQAQRDLSEIRGLKKSGNTRGREYQT